MEKVLSERELLGRMMVGSWFSQGVYVAAELGIADELAKGPCTADELSEQVNAHAGSIYRLLRALASMGIFSEDDQGRFSLTPMAELLRDDRTDSQRSFAIMSGAEFYRTWGELLHSVRTGQPGFNKSFGAPFFEYMTGCPDRHAIYDRAMNGVHGPETQPMLDAYDFSSCRTLADIGGGNGSLLAAVLERYPKLEGILFDLPAVADRLRSSGLPAGLDGRCQIVGGDFFSAVPSADAYLMRHVIHDWEDADAVRILRNCAQAMRPGGRVLVVEMVIPPGDQPGFGKWLDLMMLLVGGCERTEAQYRQLFADAGLKLNRTVPTAAEISVLEGVLAD